MRPSLEPGDESSARPKSLALARTFALDRLVAVARRLPNFRGKVMIAWCVAKVIGARTAHPSDSWRLRLDGETELDVPHDSSLMAVQIAVAGVWDGPVQRLLAPHVKPRSLVLDIGASLGVWTIPLAKTASARGGHVWAFEPLAVNVTYLERNLELNNVSEAVTVHAIALGRQHGEVGVVPQEYGAGNAAVGIDGSEGITVPVERLDDLPRERPVSLIKIDVEGYELEVFAGARRLLQEDRPVVYGEFHPEWLRRRGADLAGFLRDMERLAYDIYEVDVRHSRWWRPRDTPVLTPRAADASFSGELLLVPRP